MGGAGDFRTPLLGKFIHKEFFPGHLIFFMNEPIVEGRGMG